MSEDEYDPEWWSERTAEAMAPFADGKPLGDRGDALAAAMQPVMDAQLEAAKAAFPWVEIWFEEVSAPEFVDEIERRMSRADAMAIREACVTHHSTWRGVAGFAYEEYRRGWRLGWTMPGHQQVGMSVCEAAARSFGEDWSVAPWNG